MKFFTKLTLITLPFVMAATSCSTDNIEVGTDGPEQGELWTGSLPAAPYAPDAACYNLDGASIDDQIVESIELSASGLFYVVMQNFPGSYEEYSDTRASEKNLKIFSHHVNKKATRDWLPYQSIITGNYTKLSNGKYRLDGFGDIDVASNGKVDITLTSGESYIWKCELMPTMPDNALNSRLCRSWRTLGVKYEFLDKKYNVVLTYNVTAEELEDEFIEGLTFTSAGRMYEKDGSEWYGYTWNWSNEKGQLIQLMADDEEDGSGICQVTFDNNKICFINPWVFDDAEEARYEFYSLGCADKIPSSTKYAREIVTLIEW